MNDDTLIRLENLRGLGLSPAALTERVGNSKQYWSDMLRGRKSFGERIARRIEEKLELPRLFLDEDHGAMSDGAAKKTGTESLMGESEASNANAAHTGEETSTTNHPCIPTSMPPSPVNLKSAFLLMGNLIGALDKRRRKLIGDLLKDLADHPDDRDEVEDIAETAYGIALRQKPITKNGELERALRGKGEAVETGPAPLEH